MDCHAVFQKTARNDGQRKHTSPFRNDGGFVILSVAKNPQNLRHALNLWILRLTHQYDRKTLVILSKVP